MRSSASRERTQAGQFLRTTHYKLQFSAQRAGQEELETEAVADMAPVAGRAKALAGLAEAMAGSAPQRKRRTPLESARALCASG